jgi:hypothetical protein
MQSLPNISYLCGPLFSKKQPQGWRSCSSGKMPNSKHEAMSSNLIPPKKKKKKKKKKYIYIYIYICAASITCYFIPQHEM